MIHFMKFRWLYFFFSGIVIIPGIISLLLFRLKPGIDFTGGTELQLRIQPKEGQLSEDAVRSSLQGIEVSELLMAGNTVTVKAKPVDVEQKDAALAVARRQFLQVEEVYFETVGPILGKELLIKTMFAMLLSAGGITLYVAYRFKELKYGVCAVLAMLHDTLVLFGVFSILGKFLGVEVDILFVTAVLTILSFSVHDTIVVYDRIRELRRKHSTTAYVDLVDTAVTETMSRSVNNSMTIIFMLFVLWLFGGESMRWFLLALLVGTVTGTYSSTFTAAPLLVIWDDVARRKKK
ncbi:MAG TPA: protein translocase subunit SecF [Patescibacteria group bacterium]|nr:protein translocase subunit SecF [Patescibacteria group bacterium]